MYKVFVVEDDIKLQLAIKETLEKYDYITYLVEDFRNIEEQFDKLKPHLVLMDINLPYFDGFYFCRIFRRKSKVPIIILSARSEDASQIMGIEMGADDYITKPFNTNVFISKINAIIRRCYGEYVAANDSFSIGDLLLDDNSFKALWKGSAIELSKNEFKLLKKLMENCDKVLSREQLLEELWDDSAFVDDNTLTVNVTRVKNKLCEAGIADAIKTKRGVGYLFDSQALKGNNK